MNIRRWVFVTAPFILFTLYTYFASSSFPGAPEQMRWFVSIFLGFIVLLFLAQRALKDDNYFIPAMVMVLAVNFIVVHSVGMDQFDHPQSMAPVLRLLLERPQLILYFGLMMMALLPPILWGGSFTCYFSRLDYPEDDWKSPEFIRVNTRISYFWVVVFFLCFACQLAPMLMVQLFAPIVIVMTLGAWGTRRLIHHFISQLDVGDE